MPNQLDSLVPESSAIPIPEFLINLLLTLVISVLLAWTYRRYGRSLSNRDRFGSNFPMLALTTMLIITVVKSSLALSLGLVGALSIVRFRAAIKDPEELCFLFITIAVGLGFGAGQRTVTLIGVAFVLVAVVFRYQASRSGKRQRMMYLTVSRSGSEPLTITPVLDVLRKTCKFVDLKRFDEGASTSEAVFVVDFAESADLESTRDHLRAHDDQLRVAFLDQGGLGVA